MNLTNDEEKLVSKIKLTHPILKEIISRLPIGANLKYLFKTYIIVFENKDGTSDIVGFDNVEEFEKQYKTFTRVRLFKDLKEITKEFNNIIN